MMLRFNLLVISCLISISFANATDIIECENLTGELVEKCVAVDCGTGDFIFGGVHVDRRNPYRKYQYINTDGKKCAVSRPESGLAIHSGEDAVYVAITSRSVDDGISSKDVGVVRIYLAKPAGELQLLTDTVPGNGLSVGGNNLLRVKSKDGMLVLYAGSTNLYEIRLPSICMPIDSIGLWCAPGASAELRDVQCQPITAPSQLMTKWRDRGLVDAYLNGKSSIGAEGLYPIDLMPLEGYWELYDSNLKADLVMPGGRYLVAVVASNDVEDAYDIIYIDGAEKCKELWQPGMLKGRLLPAGDTGAFTVEWMDAECRPMRRNIVAHTENGVLLTITFIPQDSELRFTRTTP